MAAALRQKGFTCHVVDAFGEAPDHLRALDQDRLQSVGLDTAAIIERIPAESAIIGISVMFSQEWFYARDVVRAIARARPDALLVLGGEHATADYKRILQAEPSVACCVLGEGDETICELAECMRMGSSWHSVAGLALRDAQAGVIRTAPRTRIRTLDELPWPAWDLVPIETYLKLRLGYEERNQRTMPMLATRGCPYQCTFCSNPEMWGTRWVARDPQNVVDEIRFYKQKYQASHFEFYDLTAVVNRKWILAFCDLLLAQNIDVTWRMPSGTRSEALDQTVVSRMQQAGCVGLVYAPESGSETTLKRIKKRVVPARMLASIRAARRSRLHIRAHFIVGLPGQTRQEIGETFFFIARLAWIGVDDVNVFPFFPYPGSEIHHQLTREGRIPTVAADYDRFLSHASFTDLRAVGSWSEYLSAASIRRICYLGPAMFYALQFTFRPWRLLRVGYRLARKKPSTWLERYLFASLHTARPTNDPKSRRTATLP